MHAEVNFYGPTLHENSLNIYKYNMRTRSHLLRRSVIIKMCALCADASACGRIAAIRVRVGIT